MYVTARDGEVVVVGRGMRGAGAGILIDLTVIYAAKKIKIKVKKNIQNINNNQIRRPKKTTVYKVDFLELELELKRRRTRSRMKEVNNSNATLAATPINFERPCREQCC